MVTEAFQDVERRIASNPFYILDLRADASAADVRRQGQRWLGMLSLGLAAARQYQTPLGPRERTPEAVRESMAALLDPDRRIVHELWARSPVVHRRAATGPAGASGDGELSAERLGPFGALGALGFRPLGPRRAT
jgi:hypothetical protein